MESRTELVFASNAAEELQRLPVSEQAALFSAFERLANGLERPDAWWTNSNSDPPSIYSMVTTGKFAIVFREISPERPGDPKRILVASVVEADRLGARKTRGLG